MSEELLHEQTQTEAAVTMADLEEHFDDANPWNVVKSYMEKGTILPVKVEGIVNGGAIAMIEGIRGFIPASRLSLSYIEDLETYLLKDIEVRVIDVDEANNRLVLSAREILQEKARKEREARIAAVKVGSIVTGTVESLQNYGAFVDLGDGLSGLVHISQISLKRIKSPSDVLNVGDEVNVKIIGVKDGKISLSMKALEEEKQRRSINIRSVFGGNKKIPVIYPFARYEYYNPQEKGEKGQTMEKRCQVSMWTAGLNWYALPNLVIKADYATRQIGTNKVFGVSKAYNSENEFSIGIAYIGWFIKK